MFCPVCGNKINDGDNVCKACGFNLTAIDAGAKSQPSDTATGEERTVFSDIPRQTVPAPDASPVQVNKCPLEAIMISYTFCGNCGRRNITGVKFCGCCGEKL